MPEMKPDLSLESRSVTESPSTCTVLDRLICSCAAFHDAGSHSFTAKDTLLADGRSLV